MQHVNMSGAELTLKILHHERDFRRVHLTTRLSPQCPRYQATVRYLATHTPLNRSEGLDFRYAQLTNLVAHDWHFHHAQFSSADLRKADLTGSIFIGACFDRTNLHGIDLTTTYFERCEFIEAVISDTDISTSTFRDCSIHRSLVRTCAGIDRATGLNSTTWSQTFLDPAAYHAALRRLGEEQDDHTYAIGIEHSSGFFEYSTSNRRFINKQT